MQTTTGNISSGGLRLFYRAWRPDQTPRGVVAIVPGFNSHSGYYAWVAERLVAAGLAVYAIDLRGRGESEGERFYVQQFEDYVMKIAPKSVAVKITRMHGGKPWMTEFDNPFVQAAGRAIEKGFGKAPVFNREGGSIPVVATFQEILGLPSVLFGVGLPDENAHAPNEKLDLANFHDGIIASAFLYDEVGKLR